MVESATAKPWARPPVETQVHLDRWQGDLPTTVIEAQTKLLGDSENIELILALGRELSRVGLFLEAVEVYSQGIALDHTCHLLFRHRGHRYISTRRYHEAVADLKQAAVLEPDHWDTLYHLGLAYYLLGDFALAEEAYAKCLAVTEVEEHLPAIVDWYYLTLMHLGRRDEAQAMAQLVGPETEAGENEPYKQRVLVYRGLKSPEEVLEQLPEEDHMYCTGAFGIAMEYYFYGQSDKAKALISDITSRTSAWYGFAALAAAVEAGRLSL